MLLRSIYIIVALTVLIMQQVQERDWRSVPPGMESVSFGMGDAVDYGHWRH